MDLLRVVENLPMADSFAADIADGNTRFVT